MAKKDNFKKIKYEERLLNEINGLLRAGTNDVRLARVSITKVELSPDYGYATVSWDTYDSGTRGDAKTAIESAAGRIRSELAKVLEVRHVPSLTFVYDNQFEEEKKIMDLITASKDKNTSENTEE
ncbi:30S ribosome-binding factor RbfA [Bacteriovorax sp. PP10]|uniref:Ribosome-binding factor A n=1 Tax=Bacteriovorax antarcticus TaxID=3088717 RepID=A0ABU5VZR5_9BACT|nr:30S ribosome-binding factor RbfA [Bacteriovorax sp. PP10]MEA9358571.1 30S ribosome-binding factor RbfA [Bacteriovorax sp. PP10]